MLRPGSHSPTSDIYIPVQIGILITNRKVSFFPFLSSTLVDADPIFTKNWLFLRFKSPGNVFIFFLTHQKANILVGESIRGVVSYTSALMNEDIVFKQRYDSKKQLVEENFIDLI